MRYFLTVNKPIPLTPLLREYFNPLIIWPLVLIPVFKLSVEARIRYYTCCTLNCWYMYTYPYIHCSNENSQVDSSRSSIRGPGWQRAGQPLPGFSLISPLASCPSRIPWSPEVARMFVQPGASTSQRPKAESRETHPLLLSLSPFTSFPPISPLLWLFFSFFLTSPLLPGNLTPTSIPSP